ncbi:MAG: D-alanyl-D-alanine dipeptidase [Bacteroidetes bacterium]|nr:MAG: D-alanyl-D-alanine dipeptidase [Bacteroidota bacterium]
MPLRAALLLLLLAAGCAAPPVQNGRAAIVDILSVEPSIVLDIRYATANNFTGQVLYPAAKAKLRREAAESLAAVQRELKMMGLGLKVYDAYRPLAIQWKLWEVVSNPSYVADPRKGSRHNRGAAVDLTIVDSLGAELEMPTPYDDFTEKASQSYEELPERVKRNRALLRDVMERHGFLRIQSEWWHFDFHGWEQFPVMDEPL